MQQPRPADFLAANHAEALAEVIAESEIMPELRTIWPHAFADTVTAVAGAIRAHSAKVG